MKCPNILVFVLTTCFYFATSEIDVAMSSCRNTELHDIVRSIKDNKSNEKRLATRLKHLREEMYELDCNKRTPFHLAVEGSYSYRRDLLMTFINADFNLNHVYFPYEGVNPILFHAILHQNLDTIRFLLEFGSFVDMGNNDGKTPLYLAVRQRKEDLAQLLVKYGANISRTFSGGDSYLHTFVKMGNTEQVSLLVKLGAPIDVKNEQGLTPINLAVERDRIAMVNIFLIGTIDCKLGYNLWREPLAFAVSNGTNRILDLILSRIVQEPCSPINYVKDAFYTAIRLGRPASLNRIYNKGQEKDKEFFQKLFQKPDCDPVIDAIEYNSTLSFEWLLNKNITISSNELKDYFQRIVSKQNMKMIKMLTNHRPPLNTDEMNSLIDVANVSGSDAIKNYLVELKEKIGKTVVPNN